MKEIEVITTVFDGSPAYADDGTEYVPNPGPIRYSGDPYQYPEINRNWEALIAGKPYFRQSTHCLNGDANRSLR
jgi:hypothetical protein